MKKILLGAALITAATTSQAADWDYVASTEDGDGWFIDIDSVSTTGQITTALFKIAFEEASSKGETGMIIRRRMSCVDYSSTRSSTITLYGGGNSRRTKHDIEWSYAEPDTGVRAMVEAACAAR